MSRVWNSDRIGRPFYWPDLPRNWWVMRCDRESCPTYSAASQEAPPLKPFKDVGWFIAQTHGDRCPPCVAAGRINPRSVPFDFDREDWKGKDQ